MATQIAPSDPLLSEEHFQVRETASRFASEVVAPRAAAIDRSGEFPHDTFKQMAELGFLGLPFPEEYGGAGLDTRANLIGVEEISAACASTGISLAAHVSLGTAPIYYAGTEEQKRRFVPRLASGEILGAFGLTEPNAGSDAAGTQTTAVRDNGGWRVNGTKIYITNGSVAGVVVFTARTDKSKGSAGISAFVVEKGTPGFNVGKREDKMGLRASDTVELHFQDCFIPEENLLGGEGAGFREFMRTLDGGRIGIGALSLGIGRAAYEAAVAYAKERKQFGRPIGEFQLIQEMLADMRVRLECSRHLVYHAGWLKDHGRPFAIEASMAKLHASETATFCADRSVQIHGGMGYMRELPVERYYRDAKLMEIGEGTTQIQKIVIARDCLRQAGYQMKGLRNE
ncbi:MAG TPA: acyl-CoA dehydrogenase family protein [Candidatus Eisenbacteria bacterium]|jgi:alkylation response protein AidB-like acyl-CoA dehydrogenase|nr:acyl-CoA dehydrogenase family protein [Candidatus Eisenbacteria bacterium]